MRPPLHWTLRITPWLLSCKWAPPRQAWTTLPRGLDPVADPGLGLRLRDSGTHLRQGNSLPNSRAPQPPTHPCSWPPSTPCSLFSVPSCFAQNPPCSQLSGSLQKLSFPLQDPDPLFKSQLKCASTERPPFCSPARFPLQLHSHGVHGCVVCFQSDPSMRGAGQEPGRSPHEQHSGPRATQTPASSSSLCAEPGHAHLPPPTSQEMSS